MKKIVFDDNEIRDIEYEYLNNGLSCESIGKKYGVSKSPIINLLKEIGKLREGKSDGQKKILTNEDYNMIKKLYLDEKKNVDYISKKMNINKHLIGKILHNSGYRRNRSSATSLAKTGKKLNENVKKNMSIAQQKLAKSGNRIQTGGVCKKYVVNGIECQGTYEKFYIETLISNKELLPNNISPIETPFGMYYPDFSFSDKLIEIKCDYTYDVLIGLKESRFTGQKDITQYKKIMWVNKNVKPIDILIVDKRNNKIIKKEII
jgi:hypothetical protein